MIYTQKLESLFMEHNNMVSINVVGFYNLPKIKAISLAGNPFACNCDLRRFLDFVKTNNIFIGNVKMNYKFYKIQVLLRNIFIIIKAVITLLIINVIVKLKQIKLFTLNNNYEQMCIACKRQT